MKLTAETLADTDLATAWSAYNTRSEVDLREGGRFNTRMEARDAEEQNPAVMQQHGWQAILDNFGRYVEGKG